METTTLEKVALIASSYRARSAFYEEFYNNPNISYEKDLTSENHVDCLIIPCTNTYGIKEGIVKDAIDYVSTKLESNVKNYIMTNYYGDQPVGSCIILPYVEPKKKDKEEGVETKVKQKKIASFICWIPACKSLATLNKDAAFMVTWNALCGIRMYNRSLSTKDAKKKKIRTVALPCVSFSDNIAETCHQMSVAISNFFYPPQEPYDRESGYLYAENIIKQVVSDEEIDKRKELEGLIWSRELEARGLCDEEELDILVEWVNNANTNDKQSTLNIDAARTLVALLRRNRTEFTLDPDKICEKITSKNSGCLLKLLELGLSGDIELHKEITKSDLEILEKIGDGNAGSVYKARYEDRLVGVKFFSKGSVNNSQDFLRELGFLSLIKHPLVVSCYGGCTAPGNEFIVTELMESNVYEVLHDETFEMDYEMKLDFAISTAKCMSFLHGCGVIHRDLKSLNLLVSKNFEVKICDFGLSRVIDSNKAMTSNIGTVAWIAPEVFSKKAYTEKADVYSYGVILWELITRKMPFGDVEAFSIPLLVSRGERPELYKDCPAEWKKLIKSCWHQKPQMRPSFKKILVKLREIVTRLRNEKIARGEPESEERGLFIRNTAFLHEQISSDERGSSMSSLYRTSGSTTSKDDSDFSDSTASRTFLASKDST